jgi:type I restriction enzyme S subunit
MGKWVKKKLGDYVVLQGGFAFQSKDFVEDGVPLIRIGDITKEGLCDENAVKLPVNFLDECKEFALNEYDTIIAMSGATTGKCTIVSKKNLPALLNQRVGRFKIKNSSIDKLYLYYIVSSYYYQQKLLLDAIGGAQPNVSPRQIEKVICAFPILLDGSPDFSEQRRIASILSSADKVIDSTQKLIAKYKQIKQGMMEDLLKPKEGWKKVKLGEVGEILSGGTPSTLNDKYWSGNVLFVTPLDLGRRKEINTTLRTISEYGVNNSSANLITANSLAVSTRAPIGLMSIVTQNFTTNQGCKSVEFYESQNNMFHFYNMTYNVEYIRRFGQGTTFMEISKTDFSNLEFLIPDLSEQRRIASILSSIDAKIGSEEKVLEKYKKIKKGLMERLLKEEEV